MLQAALEAMKEEIDYYGGTVGLDKTFQTTLPETMDHILDFVHET